jgi:hypothetical protein
MRGLGDLLALGEARSSAQFIEVGRRSRNGVNAPRWGEPQMVTETDEWAVPKSSLPSR